MGVAACATSHVRDDARRISSSMSPACSRPSPTGDCPHPHPRSSSSWRRARSDPMHRARARPPGGCRVARRSVATWCSRCSARARWGASTRPTIPSSIAAWRSRCCDRIPTGTTRHGGAPPAPTFAQARAAQAQTDDDELRREIERWLSAVGGPRSRHRAMRSRAGVCERHLACREGAKRSAPARLRAHLGQGREVTSIMIEIDAYVAAHILRAGPRSP